VLPTIYFKKKTRADVHGIFTLWKTKHGLRILKDFAKHKNVWKWFADLGIIITFGFFGLYFLLKKDKRHMWKHIITYGFFIVMFVLIAFPAVFSKLQFPPVDLTILILFGAGPLLFYLLFQQTLSIILSYLSGGSPLPGVAPIIPGVDIPGSPIKVPLSAIFGFVVLLFVHETSHGILAMVHKIKVKSLGVLTLGIFPLGAFTEPDEKQLQKAPMINRMRVFSAGSTANFFTAAAFLIIFVLLSTSLAPVMQAMTEQAEIDYMVVGAVLPDSPAFLAGILEGTKIHNPNVLLYPDTSTSEVILKTDNGDINLNRNEEGFIGLGSDYKMVFKNIHPFYWPIYYFLEIIYWIYLLNFLVGIFNLLPLYMLDGGFLFVDLTEFYAKKFKIKKAEKFALKAFTCTSLAIVAMILINALPYFF